jgi:hypothetical protein
VYSGHKSGRAWVSARSGRKPSREPAARPVPADCPDPVARPVPADRPDAVDVRLQSKAGSGKKNEEAQREMGFRHDRRGRNKQTGITSGF